ncbi:MAG: helix-turn-helix domain-containing protein [Clostridiales bacterium]|nr:helix-turn-helix domain-containing protein [Clostridiales bacterium]
MKVDVGKIMALHNAGWSNVKIADEMDLHPVTVGKYIKQEETADGNRQD